MVILFLGALFVGRLQDPLVDLLASEDLVLREAAQADFLAMGPSAIPILKPLLDTPDPELRVRVHAILHAVGYAPLLVADLQSDDTPGNAKKARVALINAFNPEIRVLLLDAAVCDDDQLAIQAGFILAERKESPALLRRAPGLLRRAVIAWGRESSSGYSWVVGRLLLRLGAAAGEDAFRNTLRDLCPDDLHRPMGDLIVIAQALNLPLPDPLLRFYLHNLCADETAGNAEQCRRNVRRIGAPAIPFLREVIQGPDAQAREIAVDLLFGVSPAPVVRFGSRTGPFLED